MITITYHLRTEPDSDTQPDQFDCYSQEDIERFRNDDWYFIAVFAVATIAHKIGEITTEYHVSSSGLYGIDSNSGDEYINEVFKEQKEELESLFLAIKQS